MLKSSRGKHIEKNKDKGKLTKDSKFSVFSLMRLIHMLICHVGSFWLLFFVNSYSSILLQSSVPRHGLVQTKKRVQLLMVSKVATLQQEKQDKKYLSMKWCLN